MPPATVLSFSLVLATLIAGHTVSGRDPAASPEVIVMDSEWLAAAKAALTEGNTELAPALDQLVEEADAALTAGPFTVMSKTLRPPSGDRHDYLSFGPYWWPNPDTEDGLPYVRRDGERNPETRTERSDAFNLHRMTDSVDSLALAYYFTGNTRYADRAALLLHTWFLNPETAMNPNLDFGQAIPGLVDGRGIGIIESRQFLLAIDAALLIRNSDAWTEADHRSLQEWFRAYLSWLQSSPNGIDESRTVNNHGTWYDAQLIAFALFCGDRETAIRVLQTVGKSRIAAQISADGKQEHELARTKSLNYSAMNLEGMFTLARLGGKVGVDLWDYPTGDVAALPAALDFIAPYMDPEQPWPYEQISDFDPVRLLPLLRQGYLVYGDPEYLRLIESGDDEAFRRHRSVLLFPIEVVKPVSSP
ncbi:MAG: alginate lyase family protein [Opitutaceae bacterium]